jgi:hypothetical protein
MCVRVCVCVCVCVSVCMRVRKSCSAYSVINSNELPATEFSLYRVGGISNPHPAIDEGLDTGAPRGETIPHADPNESARQCGIRYGNTVSQGLAWVR